MKTKFQEIPENYQIKELKNQSSYLVAGELKEWKGEMVEVYSTISSTEYSKANEGTAITIRITAGIIVQTTSINVP